MGKRIYKALAALYEQDTQRAKAILNIDRENKKPRKDIAKWSDIPDYISYMFDETFEPCYDLNGNATPELAVKALEKYKEIVDLTIPRTNGLKKSKAYASRSAARRTLRNLSRIPKNTKPRWRCFHNYTRGTDRRTNTPDLYEITKLLGKESVAARLNAALAHYREEI